MGRKVFSFFVKILVFAIIITTSLIQLVNAQDIGIYKSDNVQPMNSIVLAVGQPNC